MKKVYCKNCLFDLGRHAVACHPFDYSFSKSYGGYVRDYKTSTSINRVQCNKDNNCLYYERKLWKFWLKYYPRKEDK